MAVQIGPKIGIDGEKEYRSQIQQIIQQSKSLDAAMEKQASTWTKSTSQMTKNRDVAQNLVKQIDLQKEKLQALNTMLDESRQKFGENASATLKWEQAVNSATANLNNMESELRSLGNAANFSDLSTKMADVGTKMQSVGQTLQSVGQKMTTAITLPIVAAGAASVKLASDTQEAANKVDVVFGSMAESVKQFAGEALNSYGLASGTAMEMAGTFGSMASAMGLSDQQAAQMATTLTGLSADMASFYNVSTEVASNSLQGIFTGETEALKKFGIVMTQTNLEAFAEQQGKVYDKMSEAEKVMTRFAFVMNATKDAQGDFSRTSDGTANSMRVFKESIKELGAAFGESLLPVVTPIVQAMTKVVQAIAKLPAPIRNVIVVIAALVAAVGPIILIVGTLMSSLGAIMTNAPLIAAAFATMIPVIKSVAAAFVELTVSAAPWLALAALLAVVGYAIYANWDEISAAASRLGDSLREAWGRIVELNNQLVQKFRGFVQGILDALKELPAKAAQALSNAWESIKQAFDNMIQNAKKSGKDMIEGFVDGIKQTINKVVKAVKQVAETVKQFLGFSCPDKGPLHEYETWMPDFMQGLAKGIRNNMGVVRSAMNGVAKTMSIPLDANATMNMALAGADGGSMPSYFGGMTTNVYVDHISELNDLIRIQNQAQQMQRMGARR